MSFVRFFIDDETRRKLDFLTRFSLFEKTLWDVWNIIMLHDEKIDKVAGKGWEIKKEVVLS
jgi:hypothetical protein